MRMPSYYSLEILALILPFTSWLPLEPLSHCLIHTQCKIVIFDTERAQLIQPAVQKLRQDSEIQAFIVFDDDGQNRNDHWPGLLSFDQTLQQYHSDGTDVTPVDIIKPEDNATIIFTSGLLTPLLIYHMSNLISYRDNRAPQGCS